MSRHHNHHNNMDTGGQVTSFFRELQQFIGRTVTIFTTSGGASGFGFTGVLISVNMNFARLITDPGTAPTNPLADVLGDMDNGGRNTGRNGTLGRGIDTTAVRQGNTSSTLVDIPINRIAAFTHHTN
jgi:hypothetical protein